MNTSLNAILGGYVSPHVLAGLPQSTPVLLALSGGADSSALLHILAQASKKEGFPLLLAHVNHGIRGEEAMRDQRFCESLAKQYGLELCTHEVDVPSLARAHGRGLEEEAREARYAYFESLMRERELPILVTAHHADDLLETVLFRLARGSGTHGLCGIAPSRRFAQGVLVRPLLQVTRRQIMDYCDRNELKFVTDCTNEDPSYARNRIRMQVVPALEELFDTPQSRVAALCADLREEDAFLESLAQTALSEVRVENGLSVSALRAVPKALLPRVLRGWLTQMNDVHLERAQLTAIGQALEGEKRPCSVTLTPDVCVLLEGDLLSLRRVAPKLTEPCYIPFRLGVTEVAELGLLIEVEKVNNLSIANTINSNEVSVIMNGALHFRTRREGDVIRRGGMHRRLRKLYNAAKIPPSLRERMPLLCDEQGIVWAPLIGARDGSDPMGERIRIRLFFKDVSYDGTVTERTFL